MDQDFLKKVFAACALYEDDFQFLGNICERFPRVEDGLRRFHVITPEQRPEAAHQAAGYLLRSGWKRIGVPEKDVQTVFEHTQGCITIADYLADDNQYLKRMLLVHDNITEPVTGDFTPYDKITRGEKARLESLVFQFMLAGTPKGSNDLALWTEFEDGITPTAQLANDIDKLEMVTQAGIYGKRYPHLQPQLQEFWDYTRERMKTLLGQAYFLNLHSIRKLDSLDTGPSSP